MSRPPVDLPARTSGPVSPPRPVALVGPTASGKSSLALAVARARDDGGPPVELISVYSMAGYRGMDIGTAKPSAAVCSPP